MTHEDSDTIDLRDPSAVVAIQNQLRFIRTDMLIRADSSETDPIAAIHFTLALDQISQAIQTLQLCRLFQERSLKRGLP